jgi:Zn-finger nucleic acid-binding protein
MPLLLCPNDNAAMQTIDRDGVQFDMCPTCRGVWLDRGELEKLMAASALAAPAPAPQPPQGDAYRSAPPPQQAWGAGYGDRDRRDDRDRDHYRQGGYRKKKSSIFDIFD